MSLAATAYAVMLNVPLSLQEQGEDSAAVMFMLAESHLIPVQGVSGPRLALGQSSGTQLFGKLVLKLLRLSEFGKAAVRKEKVP